MSTPRPIPDPTPHVPEDFHGGGIAGHPKGLSNLFFAELWERFSYYGMRALLMLFMIAPVASGGLGFPQPDAAAVYGNYVMSSYMLCILGGFIADNFIGARRAVLIGGFIITAGHYALAFDSVPTFYAGLILIAVGTGLLKPSISTLVGGLYRRGDSRRDAGFSLFYMGINIGAFAAPLVTGYLAQDEGFKQILVGWGLDPRHSWHWGFGAAGIGMTLGMWVYVRRLNWIRHVGDAPTADHQRPWERLALVALGTRQPSVALKFTFGLLFLGLSFALMVPAAQGIVAGKVSPWWLIGVYFLQTLGEMCLSPVGLSTMSKLAPERLTGLVLGVWFMATALGNKLSGTLSAGFPSKDPVELANFFRDQAIVVGLMALVLLALVPWVRHLMGKDHH